MNSENQPLVYILILQYGSYQQTAECIESVRKLQYKNYKTIVIDNNSPDNSLSAIKSIYPDLEIISLDRNRLFAGAYNYAAIYIRKHKTEPDYLLILNNDIIIKDTYMLDCLIKETKAHHASVSGPRILEPHGVKRPLDKINIFTQIFHNTLYPITLLIKSIRINNRKRNTRLVYTVTGSCMLIRYDHFMAVNGFEDRNRLYFEEYYLSDKIHSLGGKVIYVPKTYVYHRHSKTIDERFGTEEKRKIYIQSFIEYLNINNTLMKRIITFSFSIFYKVYFPLIVYLN